jgi:hypothetical protein
MASVMIRPKEPSIIRNLLPNRSIKLIARIVKMKLIRPIPAVESNAELDSKPAF